MLKSILSVGIGGLLLLPFQSLKSQTYLNFSQPYVNSPNAKEPYLTKKDNDDFWKNLKLIREKRIPRKSILNIKNKRLRYRNLRLTIDKKKDLQVVRQVENKLKKIKKN